ncbi:allophanate hydrolase [Gordonia sp. SL306]|uniref:allophanate hydrolase n=1 Tax=Gordonia sp. SL306 TaxID=2995145 RepID=UPI002271C928|nr:allophanate hydrolase [Gordonia sp. SL306]WAC56669.1 allophanate hydrolase [Gordonia sp. SL306]
MSRITDIYRRIDEADRPEVFIALRPQSEVLAEHQDSLATGGPLAGIVLAVKDNVDVAGLPTTAACPDYAYVPSADAPAVAALRSAGAVIIGKTNLDQFATGLVGTRSPYGAVRDSRRLDRISGGSSSGSAVAVALGLADIAIGTDTAGSGRVPAGLQGIVGIKPTLGVVSTEGVVPACASYDTATIFAADLDLANRAMAVMARAQGKRPFGPATRLAATEQPTVAVPADLPELDDAWRDAFAAAVTRAEAAGLRIKPIDLGPFLAAAKLLYEDALVAERYDAVGQFVDAAGCGLDPVVSGIISGAKRFDAVDLLRARRRLAELHTEAMAEWGDADALLVPTAPMHPTLAEVDADPIGVNSRMGTYTNFCNLFDLCGLAVPAGQTDETDGTRAEFGVTFLGRAHDDAAIADLARRFLDGTADAAPAWPEVSGAPATELAVFGAHMRGGPLTHELSDRGARWSREVATAPNYRLVALDTVPAKPGLLRDPERGQAIQGEVWTLSPAALGEFLAALPAPMMLGSVELSDGRWVVGFGCAADAGDHGEQLDRTRW